MHKKSVKALGEDNIFKLILKFSLPAILATLANATYNVVDRIFIGNACDADAIAAVTVSFPPTLLLLALGMAIGQGSGTLISIKLGRHDKEGAEEVLGQAVFMFIAFYIISVVGILLFIEDFLRLFGATDKILENAVIYFRIIVLGRFFESVAFGLNNQIRSEGRPIFSMTTTLLSCVLNVFFDWLFLFKFNWGVAGAAYATVLSQIIGSLWVMYFYVAKKGYLELKLKNIKGNLKLIMTIIYAGSPSLIIQTLSSLSMTVAVRQSGNYGGESAIAVVGISMAVITFIFLPVMGLSMGTQPIVGYNWGARNYQRVRSALFAAICMSTVFCALGSLVAQLFSFEIFSIFIPNEQSLIQLGENSLSMMTMCFAFVGVNISTSAYYQSTKRPKMAVVIPTIRQLILLAPLMIILPKWYGLNGIWASFAISDILACIFTLLIIRYELNSLSLKIKGSSKNWF